MNATSAVTKLCIEQLLKQTFGNLSKCYKHHHKGTTTDDYLDKFCAAVKGNNDPTIVDHFDIIRRNLSVENRGLTDEQLKNSPTSVIILGTTYAFRTIQSLEKDSVTLAIQNLADSAYWAGVAMASTGVEKAYLHTVQETQKSTKREAGKSGAQGRNEIYEPIRDYAYELVRMGGTTSGTKKWKSRQHAVSAIQDKVFAHAKARGIFMKGENSSNDNSLKGGVHVSRTIDGWLKKMPDAEEYFPKKAK
ncbi:hypothetical protein [uncultured Oxalicibacterium sp.]|uniref:hypothetical protein n=1 Tax=uncultured Oxalicibacterium sp. TaxID=1168540 RepID=UPI0025CFC86A|nr:hypothetical protein [uncultured Oxalicibacterium sp.]